MPVVESYPSIVGIAQVAQSAGQGRYNQWLAEYNARSNQMKTNALMSGFQVGSNLGMSTARMWQQQQQFAQRQGHIESQAAQRLQKDTEYAAAMTPALKPYLQKLYPHATDQEIGTMIGSMDRNQLEGLSNTITNAGRATAWQDMLRSPHALRREAENTYRNMMAGREHHNARVQSRLQPIHDRLRNADFAFNESAIQGEIARILREEGAAGPTTNPQEQYDKNEITVLNGDGQPAYKVWQTRDGKVHTFDVRDKGARGAGGTPEYDWRDVDKANGIVDSRHTRNVEDWQRIYGGYEGQDPDPDQVATYVDPTDGTMWRKARPGEQHPQMRVSPFGGVHVPATIPPRPTRNMARNQAIQDNPGLRQLLIPGARPSEIGAGIPTPRPRVFADGRSAELRRGDATILDPQAVQRAAQPQAVPGGQPGQVMPSGPQPRRPDLSPQLRPSLGGQAEYGPAGIAETGRVRPGDLMQRGDVDRARDSVARQAQLKSELRGRAILGLRERHGNQGQVALSSLIGTESSRPTEMTVNFERHVRSGADPTAFASQILQKEETAELEKAIPKFGSKLGTGGGARADLYSGFDKPSSWRQRAEENLKGPDNIAYRKISSDYRRRRNAVLTIAGAAVQATPPGQRVDIANIPSFTVGEFDRAVERGDMRVGFVILTNKGVTPVTAKDIQNAHDRLWKRRGVPLRNQMR